MAIVRDAPPRRLWILAALTAAGTVPYLALKTNWLLGGTIGVRDAALLADPSTVALNVVTAVADLLVVALTVVLAHDVGRRIPAWLLLLPVWVGTGFLIPMAVAILPSVALGPAAPATGPFEPWLQPLVYGGFAWQGVGLTVLFAGHATRRWCARVRTGGAVDPVLRPLLRVLVAGGGAAAAVSGVLHVVAAASDPLVAVPKAVFAVAAVAGVARLARGPADHPWADRRWAAAVAAWIGTGALFSWGLWSAVLTMAGTAMAAPDPVSGPADLAGLLGAFALAVAGLLAVTAARRS